MLDEAVNNNASDQFVIPVYHDYANIISQSLQFPQSQVKTPSFGIFAHAGKI